MWIKFIKPEKGKPIVELKRREKPLPELVNLKEAIENFKRTVYEEISKDFNRIKNFIKKKI